MSTHIDKETGNCWECGEVVTCMHCHPEHNPAQTARIVELEAALERMILLYDPAALVRKPESKIVSKILAMARDTLGDRYSRARDWQAIRERWIKS